MFTCASHSVKLTLGAKGMPIPSIRSQLYDGRGSISSHSSKNKDGGVKQTGINIMLWWVIVSYLTLDKLFNLLYYFLMKIWDNSSFLSGLL